MFNKLLLLSLLINFVNSSVAKADDDGFFLQCFGFDRWRSEQFYFSQLLDGYFKPVGKFYARNPYMELLQGSYTPRVFKLETEGEYLLREVELRVFHPNGEEALLVIFDVNRADRNRMSVKINFGQMKYSSKGADVSCTLSRG